MKTLAQPLREHLASGVTTMCYCWRVTRTDGLVQGFTEHDEDLRFDGTTFLAASGFSASQVQQSLGLAADNLSVTGALSSTAISEDDLAAGRYDDATVELFWVNWRDPEQRLLQMAGYTGEAKRTGLAFTAELRGLASRLSQSITRTFQRTCDARLGDSRCKVGLSSSKYKATGEIAEVLGPRTMRVTGLGSYTNDWFSQGVFSFVSSSAARCMISSQGLIVNAFHDEEGREGYFSPASGTSESQFLMIYARVRAASVLQEAEPEASASFAARARAMVEGGWLPMYGGRRPTEVAPTEIWAPHWLFAARSSIRLRRMVLDREVAFTAHGAGQIRGVLDDDDTVTVYQVYDAGGTLLWANPYSNVLNGARRTIVSTASLGAGNGWEIVVSGAPAATYKVAYAASDGPVMAEGSGYEAWPAWRDLGQGEIDCAADTLRWAYDAYRELAAFYPSNTLYAAARDLTAASIPQAFTVDDGRALFKKHAEAYGIGESGLYTYATEGKQNFWYRNAQGFLQGDIGADPEPDEDEEGEEPVVYEAQIGRGYPIELLTATDKIRVACSISAPTKKVWLFVDTAEGYATDTRYYTEIGQDVGGTKILDVRLSDLRRKDHADNATLASQAGSFPLHLTGAGFTSSEPEAHSIVIFEVRPMPQLRLPYQPWVVPFTVNLLEGEIIDWRGSPGVGYQGPDLWGWLGEPEGARVQCHFLRDAQLKWQADTGQLGPFAHCFVWDRPDKSEFGDPEAGSWIYTWHDPNSRWGGYQYRPLEATARLLCERGNDAAFADAIALAKAIVSDWLLWLDGAGWPGTGGPDSNDIAGPPTDFMPGAVARGYEEPHFAALLLRTALWALGSGELTGGAAAAARSLITRAWIYLEDLHVASGPMAGTWSPEPQEQHWYGFWHAEIIITLAQLLEPAFAGIAAERGIAATILRARLVASDAWIAANTRPRGFNDGIAIDVKRHVKDEDGTTIELWHAPAFGLQPGWTFHVTAGCKLTAAMCQWKFDNILNFQGFPTMPGNDVVMRNVNLNDRLNGQGLIELSEEED